MRKQIVAQPLLFADGDNKVRDSVYKLTEDETVTALCLDMSEIPILNSYGVGILFCLRRRLHAHGAGLELINVQPDVKTVVRILGLDAILL